MVVAVTTAGVRRRGRWGGRAGGKTFSFTIYDYKEDWEQHVGCATGANDYLYTTKIDWHIGGKSADDTILVKVWLKNKLNELNHN